MQVGDVSSRRRRPIAGHVSSSQRVSSGTTATTIVDDGTSNENGDYYDDDSDTDIKGNRLSHDDRMYGSACSFGQFVLNPCLCLLMCGQRGWIRIRRKWRKHNNLRTSLPIATNGKSRRLRQGKADQFLLWGILAFSTTICCLFWIRGMLSSRRITGRPGTDKDVDFIPIVLPLLDYKRWTSNDIGGWQYAHHFFLPQIPIESVLHAPGYYDDLEFVGPFGIPRTTRPDEKRVSEQYLAKFYETTKGNHPDNDYTETLQDTPSECYRQNWMQLYSPSCNDFHQLDLSEDFQEEVGGLGNDQLFDTFYISHGYWRDVWVVDQKNVNVKSIVKMSRWKHEYSMSNYWNIVRDALVMERLTKSPRIVDIYGHCAFSVWVEAIPFEVEEYVVPGDGVIAQEDLHDEEELKPQNDFDEEEKLEKALAMAESIADLHGFEDGLIVHDDVQLCQWLQTRDGKLKLGDFNRAEIPEFHPTKQEYCKYNNGQGWGNYRAPEEFAAKDLDEQIDVFSFGNNIYGLLTGLWVFYENEDDEIVQKKVKRGETAYIDPRWRTHSFITGKLVEVMEKCWLYHPEDRITIFEAVRLLREIKQEYLQLKQVQQQQNPELVPALQEASSSSG